MAAYALWQGELDRQREAIERGEPIQVSVRDETLAWRRVEAVVAKGPLENSEPAAVLADRGEIIEKGEWSIRVLQELDDEAFVFSSYFPVRSE